MGPFEQLLTQPSGPNVAPETLELLGRQASQLFQSQGVPLNQAITQILANHPELGNEHVKRIVEFANQVTFQEMFQNGQDKNVHFDIADPGVILRDLKDGGSPAHDGKTLSDYQRSPQAQSQSSGLDAALMQQFTGSSTPNTDDGQMKLAFARELNQMSHDRHANPVEDVYDAHLRLQATREKLAESNERLHRVLGEAREELYQQVKYQVMDQDGAGLGGVLSALEKMAEADIVEVLMTPITERLVKEGVSGEELRRSLTKTAGEVPNLEHPLFTAVDALLKVASEIITCNEALDSTEKMLADTTAMLKNAGAITTGVKKAVGPQGRVPAGIRQRFPRS